MSQQPLFSLDDLKEAKADEREKIVDAIIKLQKTRPWSIQTPDTVFTVILDEIRKLK